MTGKCVFLLPGGLRSQLTNPTLLIGNGFLCSYVEKDCKEHSADTGEMCHDRLVMSALGPAWENRSTEKFDDFFEQHRPLLHQGQTMGKEKHPSVIIHP